MFRKIYVFLLCLLIGLMMIMPAMSEVVDQVRTLTSTDMITDAAGNIYVTGYGYNLLNSDCFVTKYGPDGVMLWSRVYNGPANGGDQASSIALDADGNVIIAGRVFGGNVERENFLTVKYDPNGAQLWAADYNGPASGGDWVVGMGVDSSGNIIVAGVSYNGSGAGNSYAVVKYSPGGSQLWVKRYGGSTGMGAYCRAMFVDGSGNSYVTGDGNGGTSQRANYDTVKYAPDGAQRWARSYNGPGSSFDYPYDIVADAIGNAYVTGNSVGNGTNADYATIKYDTDGSELWVRRYDSLISAGDYAYTVDVDSSGNVYVSCNSRNQSRGMDFVTIKYNPSGIEQWASLYDSGYFDQCRDLIVDAAGNVYVTGMKGSQPYLDYATLKYDTNGNLIWANVYDNTYGFNDFVASLALDGDGNLIVAGGNYISKDVVRYDPSGAQQLVINILPDPEVMIARLIQWVGYIDAKNNAVLTNLLKSAQNAYVKAKSRDFVSAVKIMEAFINACIRDSQLDFWDREDLIWEAERIIKVLKLL